MATRSRFLPQGWYPGSAESCRREIDGYNEYISRFQVDRPEIRGGVVPHAGWYFSGRLAALVMNLASRGNSPDVVAVFGGHLGKGAGIIYLDDAWETPMGQVEIDTELAEAVRLETGVQTEGPSTNDNTVEVQIPLVQYFFPKSRLLALRLPHSDKAVDIGRSIAEIAQRQNKSIACFGSTDLTHYGPNYGFQPKGLGREALKWVQEVNDQGFVTRALTMDFRGLLDHAAENRSACSAGAVAAAAAACQAMGSGSGVLMDYFTSYDIMPGDSFVGYAGIVY